MDTTITNDLIREIIFSGNEDTRQDFLQHFDSEIEAFVASLTRAHKRLEEMGPRVPYDKRSAWVDQFLFVAFNSLLTSFHLLISGFLIPAGNLMRHYAESVAMALLLSHRGINTFEVLESDPELFAVHKALDIVKKKRNAKLLGIDSRGWQEFSKITSFYAQYSHASVFAGASIHDFSSPGSRYIGASFDCEKVKDYKKEILLRISACKRFYETVLVVEKHLLTSEAISA